MGGKNRDFCFNMFDVCCCLANPASSALDDGLDFFMLCEEVAVDDRLLVDVPVYGLLKGCLLTLDIRYN